jgi:FkbM family methyltransferase
MRDLIERLSRNRSFKRRLPGDFGSRTIWVSPDARLRFLKPGARGFDRELLDFARNFLKVGNRVIDVGANVGEFSVAAAHCVGKGGSVLALEPDPFLVGLLHKTIAEKGNNDLQLKVLCSAASNATGLAHFAVARRGRAANALSSFGTNQMGGSRFDFLVCTATIDHVVRGTWPPDFIKIDVEGAERLVLLGAQETLSFHRPLVLFEASRDLAEIEKIFSDSNYRLFDPTRLPLGESVAICSFSTLAVPAEKLETVRQGIRASDSA